MSIIDTLKKWLGLAEKPVQPTEPEHKTVTLPNGRRALVDKRGNFVDFERTENR